jgi:hypothetical protein
MAKDEVYLLWRENPHDIVDDVKSVSVYCRDVFGGYTRLYVYCCYAAMASILQSVRRTGGRMEYGYVATN